MRPDSPASQTALMVAAYRARATAAPTPLCRDEWAAALAGPAGAALAAAFDAHVPHMGLWLALRAGFLDRQVARWTAERGIAQVVVLGAGLDTRAARLARPGVRFFEVDHPATQADKRARLAALPGYPAEAATYAACDFEAGDDWVAGLVAVGFEPAAPALILWEGVAMYLTEAAVRATATRVVEALPPASVLVFDHVGKRMASGEQLREPDEGARSEVAAMGEPIRWGSDDPLPLLAECGFRWVVRRSFDELALAATGTYDRARAFRFSAVMLASGEAPDPP